MLGKVYDILQLMNQVQDKWEDLTSEQQGYLNGMHNESYSLGFCIRWGQQAAEECLVCMAEDMEQGNKVIAAGHNQIYLDRLAGDHGLYVVEKNEGDGMYSVLDGFEDLEDAIKTAQENCQ